MAMLEVNNLCVSFHTPEGEVHAVSGVDFSLEAGDALAIVGESGSGKTQSMLAILGLLAENGHASGSAKFRNEDLLQMSPAALNEHRGKDIAMIFQEPMTSLNPVFTVGMQVMESLRFHEGLDDAAASARAAEMLELVGIPDATKRLSDYPHQFSGGMRQRVMIAMAMICNPKLLIADEPTTALDVTIQAQILDLMKDLQSKREGASIVLITHDLAVVAETCDRVLVMYGGQIQEVASAIELFDHPEHPYTDGLLGSIPRPSMKGKPLRAIPGNVPSIMNFPAGCRFSTRCEKVMDRCHTVEPDLIEIRPGHLVRCHLHEEPPTDPGSSQ